MGLFLSVLNREPDHDIIVDLEGAQPDPASRELYDACDVIVHSAEPLLAELAEYGTGCTAEIRVALTTPTPENELAAWEALIPRVILMKSLYDYSTQLAAVFPRLLAALCVEDPQQSMQDALSAQQALAKQLAHIFDTALRFDQLKMQAPQLQNDFAFYRRNLGRVPESVTLPIKDNDTTDLSMFFASPNPLMHALTDSSLQLSSNDKLKTAVLLSAIASACSNIVMRKAYQKSETHVLALRCMVASIVIYDHIDSLGAFHKRSKLELKKCVRVLTKHSEDQAVMNQLVATLRYTTKHFKDAETPSSIVEALS